MKLSIFHGPAQTLSSQSQTLAQTSSAAELFTMAFATTTELLTDTNAQAQGSCYVMIMRAHRKELKSGNTRRVKVTEVLLGTVTNPTWIHLIRLHRINNSYTRSDGWAQHGNHYTNISLQSNIRLFFEEPWTPAAATSPAAVCWRCHFQ